MLTDYSEGYQETKEFVRRRVEDSLYVEELVRVWDCWQRVVLTSLLVLRRRTVAVRFQELPVRKTLLLLQVGNTDALDHGRILALKIVE